jgi:hypothetical protein
MTTSTLPARYKINGLIDTANPVMQSLENICNACGTFLSYDIHQGKWAVIINRAGNAVKDFDNSNIIGSIQINGTSLTQLYNSVIVEYPLRDTVDQTDYVQVTIPAEDLYANEPNNVLKITLEMCNEPVQAEIIGLIELKQSRIDQIITFQSDFSTLDLNAGDIITVTNDIYQFNQKPFRVITLSEIDADDGSIRIEVTALAYDANVYDTSDLSRYIRSDRNGIRGIGSIGTPITPEITVFDQAARPGIQVESVVPAGIVESMELWLSSDNTNFLQVATEYPVGGGTFAAGDTVVFDYDQLGSQNIYVKTRGMNSTTTGPFSPVDSFLSFIPVQTTDAVTENTGLIGSSGPIALALGLATILNKLTSLFSAGDTATTLVNALAAGGLDKSQTNTIDYGAVATQSALNAMAAGYTDASGYNLTNVSNNAIIIPFTLSQTFRNTEITVTTPLCDMDYNYYDGTTVRSYSPLVAQPPVKIDLVSPALSIIGRATIDWQNNTTRFSFSNLTPGTYFLQITIVPSYALNMRWVRSGLAANEYNTIYFTNFVTSEGLKAQITTY